MLQLYELSCVLCMPNRMRHILLAKKINGVIIKNRLVAQQETWNNHVIFWIKIKISETLENFGKSHYFLGKFSPN